MKILLAGGAGYIGSVLAPILLEHDYDVEVIDLLWFGHHLPKEVKVIRKELSQCRTEDFKSYDQVIFLAGISNDPMAEFNPLKTFVDNGALPSYLAYNAKRAGVKKFIYASSCSVYGYAVDKLFDEESPAVSDFPYGISKLQGERGVLQMQADHFSVIALRQGTVCGYSPRMRFDLIVNTMFKTAMTEHKINIHNPSIWRPIMDVRDAASAFVRAIQADDSIHGVFNVTSGNYTVGQVGDLVKQEVEKKTGHKIKLALNDQQDLRNYKVTIEKAKTRLGFQPLHDILDIIDELYDHLDDYQDYERDEFYNIRTFRKLTF